MKFRHYKTKEIYEFVGLALDEGSLETLVIYKASDGRLRTRPVRAFFAVVPGADGRLISRFSPVVFEKTGQPLSPPTVDIQTADDLNQASMDTQLLNRSRLPSPPVDIPPLIPPNWSDR